MMRSRLKEKGEKMEQENKDIFKSFMDKALKRMDEKKVRKTAKLYIPSLDTDITVRGLSRAEVIEVMDVDTSQDLYAADQYSVYIARVEPDFKKVAAELKEAGKITEPVESVGIMEIHEMQDVARKVMELSGVSGKKKVQEVKDSLKN